MERFAALYQALDATRSLSAKQALLVDYFRTTPPEDAAWGLWFLLGHRLKRVVGARELRQAVTLATGLSPVLIEACYAHVGDLAETIALLMDDAPSRPAPPRPLHQWVAQLQALSACDDDDRAAVLIGAWCGRPFGERLLITKLLTGGLRVGVSRGLAARALAEAAGLPEATVARRLAGRWQASVDAYTALLAPQGTTVDPAQPYPFALAAPLEQAPDSLGAVSDWLAEWKWDGIRAQLIRREGQVALWSRGDELLNGRFPELEAAAARLPDGSVLDGEVLAWLDHRPQPFAQLQRRIGRLKPSKRLMQEVPLVFLAYDLLEQAGQDLRHQPLRQRRAQLAALLAAEGTTLQLSPSLAATDWSALALAREGARARGVEGLMLKHLDSAYPQGRRRGAWWKWKLDPRSIDAVLVYAQAGHGRRANLYTDYTLAVWDDEGQLVPVTKAYSGLTDDELVAMDRWIRQHTRERFGPVRSVSPEQVFEIAFEGLQVSPRHKSGIALRFPRIARWRRDKRPEQADTLANVRALLAVAP